jgi:hypothetical protein
MMSGGRKPVQNGVRVKLPAGTTWDNFAAMTPDEIRSQKPLPAGFMPLPHVEQATGGQVFPNEEIDEINRQEGRSLRRFDDRISAPVARIRLWGRKTPCLDPQAQPPLTRPYGRLRVSSIAAAGAVYTGHGALATTLQIGAGWRRDTRRSSRQTSARPPCRLSFAHRNCTRSGSHCPS